MKNYFEGHSRKDIEQAENTVALFYNTLRNIISMEESTRHHTCFPETDIDCKDYFQKHINNLSELLKNQGQSLPLIVMCRLDRILNEVNVFLNCYDIPGVCDRWMKLDPRTGKKSFDDSFFNSDMFIELIQ